MCVPAWEGAWCSTGGVAIFPYQASRYTAGWSCSNLVLDQVARRRGRGLCIVFKWESDRSLWEKWIILQAQRFRGIWELLQMFGRNPWAIPPRGSELFPLTRSTLGFGRTDLPGLGVLTFTGVWATLPIKTPFLLHLRVRKAASCTFLWSASDVVTWLSTAC